MQLYTTTLYSDAMYNKNDVILHVHQLNFTFSQLSRWKVKVWQTQFYST